MQQLLMCRMQPGQARRAQKSIRGSRCCLGVWATAPNIAPVALVGLKYEPHGPKLASTIFPILIWYAHLCKSHRQAATVLSPSNRRSGSPLGPTRFLLAFVSNETELVSVISNNQYCFPALTMWFREALFLVTLPMLFSCAFSQNALILSVQIMSPNTTICLPLTGSLALSLKWGDSPSVANHTAAVSGVCGNGADGIQHTYASSGVYTVSLDRLASSAGPTWLEHFGSLSVGDDVWSQQPNIRILKVESFGNLGLSSLALAFDGCRFLSSVPADLPLSVTQLNGTFRNAISLNSANISLWNVASVTTTARAFEGATAFNQPLNGWNMVALTNMEAMFKGASMFNQDLHSWVVSSVVNMNSSFENAASFSSDLSSWCVPLIPALPSYFASGSLLDSQRLPRWGDCAPQTIPTPTATPLSSISLGPLGGVSITPQGGTMPPAAAPQANSTLAPPFSDSSSSGRASNGSLSPGSIAGGVVGGAFLLFLAIAVTLVIVRQKLKERADLDDQPEPAARPAAAPSPPTTPRG